jgi:serine/threonine protein kinase
VIKKIIQKDKLFSPLATKFAQQECAIQAIMNHGNVVRLYEYTETESDYVLYLEYCDRADYLSTKILEVSHHAYHATININILI